MRNIENKILNQNIQFSKTLKEIDVRLKFKDDTGKYFKELKKKIYKRKKNKEIFEKKTRNHEELINSLKKLEEENIIAYNNYSKNFKNNLNNKSNNSTINLSSTMSNFLALPKISKCEDNDNEKNDDLDIIRFKNVWKEQQMNDIKYNKEKKIKNKTLYNNDCVDIFDKNYDKYRKKVEAYNEKNIRLNRIKSNNLKVKKKVKIYRHIKSKFQDLREYCPNYSVIEKHQPEVKLNTKSKRIFPDKFIKKYLYKNDNNDYKNEEIKSIKKIIRNKSDLLDYTKKAEAVSLYKIIYRNNKRNAETDFSLSKNKFFISSIDIKDNGHNNNQFFRAVNNININRDESSINRRRNQSCLWKNRNNNIYNYSINSYCKK